jgi:multiple sugar transport system permease protein
MMKFKTGKIVKWIVLIILTVLFLTPFYVLFRNAVVGEMQIVSPMGGWLPWPMQIVDNFKEVFNHRTVDIKMGLINSIIMALSHVVFGIFITMLAGYALARIPFKRKKIFFFFILGTLMIPAQLIFIPIYVVVSKLHLVNTYGGLILPGIFYALNAIMFRQFFLDFPREIEESGFLDGLGYFGVFFRLVVPNSKAIIIALSAITLMNSWNQFLWPLIVGQDKSLWTAQVSLSALISVQRIIIHQVFMAGFIILIPMVIIFLILQRHLVKGVTFSGIKG